MARSETPTSYRSARALRFSNALLGALLGASFTQAAVAAAQDTVSAAQRAAREQACVAAEPRVMQDSDVRVAQRGQYALRFCPETGARILVERWRRPPTTEPMLRDLVTTSAIVRDERVFDAMLQTVGDRTQLREVRLKALSVASHHADITFLPVFGKRIRDDRPLTPTGLTKYLDFEGRLPEPLSRSTSHVTGSRPILGDARQRLIAVLDNLMRGNETEDEHLVGAARFLLMKHFKVPMSGGSPLDTAFVRRIKPGQTTINEVRERFGVPQVVVETGETVEWKYSYWETNRSTPGTAGRSGLRTQTLSIKLRDGKVVDYSLSLTGR